LALQRLNTAIQAAGRRRKTGHARSEQTLLYQIVECHYPMFVEHPSEVRRRSCRDSPTREKAARIAGQWLRQIRIGRDSARCGLQPGLNGSSARLWKKLERSEKGV